MQEILILAGGKEHFQNQRGAFNCTYCGTPTAHRSHRKNFFEYMRSRFSGKVPFRCARCARRFWLLIDPRDIQAK